ncbi:MAG: TonB family protein [Aquabacterium sp.]|nr:TonB family protein [Aquabacterium sp.]
MNAAAASVDMGTAGGQGLRPRTSDGWVPSLALAVGVHLMLLAALTVGVRWKSHPPQPIEAEVWAEIPKIAVTEVQPPPPTVEPQPEAPVPPVFEPEPPAPEPIPDLVVAKKPHKKEPKEPKEPKKIKHREPVEVFESAPPKVAVVKPAPVKVTKPTTVKSNQPDVIERAVLEAERQRKDKLQRMMSDLGSLGTPSPSAGPSASYIGRIRARIKPNILFTDSVAGNPQAVVEVRCAPDGRIISRKLLTSSGVPSFDTAVLRAIERTEVLPADESGRVQPLMEISFRPNDF